jgi:uncharacterized membrane protein (DUF4010 family)
MTLPTETMEGLVAALGLGSMIGLERERRRAGGSGRAPGGIRTFAIAALLGALATIAGGGTLFVIAVAIVGVLTTATYVLARDEDPGITTEVALVVTTVLGGLAVTAPVLAILIGVLVTALLASRDIVHPFIRQSLTDIELRDGLLLAVAALVVWPLLADRPIDPLGAINPRNIWAVVVLVLLVGAAGYVAVRIFGARFGLPFVGLASGFVSSTATIGAMAGRAKEDPTLLRPAVAAATLSTVATFVQLALVLGVLAPSLLIELLPALLAGGAAAAVYAMAFIRAAVTAPVDKPTATGRPFDPRTAVYLAVAILVISVVTAALNRWLGSAGLLVGAGAAGFADVHAAATAIAGQVGGRLDGQTAAWAVLVALSTNTLSKVVVAVVAGDSAYRLRILPGLIVVLVAAWTGFQLSR